MNGFMDALNDAARMNLSILVSWRICVQVKATSSVSHDTPPNVWWCGYACHMIGDAVYPDASPTTPYSPYFADASTKLDRLIIGNARASKL